MAEFVYNHMHDIVADCVDVLRAPVKSECAKVDRWGKWIKDVLCRACDFLGDVTADEVLAETMRMRDESDDDLEEVQMLIRGVLEWIAEERHYVYHDQNLGRYTAYRTGREYSIFLKSSEMLECFKRIMGKPKLSAKQVNHIIQGHLEAGRMKEFEYKRTAAANGYEVLAAGRSTH